MAKEDWYRVSMSKDPVEVEWSPFGEQNVRVKGKNGKWIYGSAKRADEAYSIACQLLEQESE